MDDELGQKHLIDKPASACNVGDHAFNHMERLPKQHKVCSEAQTSFLDRLVKQARQRCEARRMSISYMPDPFVNDRPEGRQVDGFASRVR